MPAITTLADVLEFCSRFPAETENLRKFIIGAAEARQIAMNFAADPAHTDYPGAKFDAFRSAEKALSREIGDDEDYLTDAYGGLVDAIGSYAPEPEPVRPWVFCAMGAWS